MSDLHFENLDLPSVSIVRTTPAISEEELFAHRQCYIGISLDNPVFEGTSLHALLLWIAANFDERLVVVGDYLLRFNEYIFNGLNHNEATKVANHIGDSFILRTRKLFQQFHDGKTHLTRWKSHLDSDDYKESRAILDNLFESDSAFRASVERDAFSFMRRQTRRNRTIAVQMEDAIKFSTEYLLEEIAVFSALSEQGWQVELYPGPELRVLVDIAKGKYLGIPKGLKERINVELKIRKTSPD